MKSRRIAAWSCLNSRLMMGMVGDAGRFQQGEARNDIALPGKGVQGPGYPVATLFPSQCFLCRPRSPTPTPRTWPGEDAAPSPHPFFKKNLRFGL